jgi:cytochrome c biogenesis protein CcmG, thiol:disulfide interchange protein DsbE
MATAEHPNINDVIPGSAIEGLNAEELDGKVVYLDFWASWCVPCRQSFPWMNDMQQQFGDQGLTIVAVNVDKDPALAEQFLADYPAEFLVVFDPEATLAAAYDITGMPSSFIIGRDGAVVGGHAGFRVKRIEDYEAAIRNALVE